MYVRKGGGEEVRVCRRVLGSLHYGAQQKIEFHVPTVACVHVVGAFSWGGLCGSHIFLSFVTHVDLLCHKSKSHLS